MISAIGEVLATYGLPGAIALVGLYMLLRSEFVFRYPARTERRGKDNR